MKKKMGPTFYSQYPGTTVDLVVRHQNGKTITVKPEPIGWTPPTEEEHKALLKSADELLFGSCGECRTYPCKTTCSMYALKIARERIKD